MKVLKSLSLLLLIYFLKFAYYNVERDMCVFITSLKTVAVR